MELRQRVGGAFNNNTSAAVSSATRADHGNTNARDGGYVSASRSSNRKDDPTPTTRIPLTERLQQISNIISEYFDEPGNRYFTFRHQPQPVTKPPNLKGFADNLRQIPFAGYEPQVKQQEKKVTMVAATKVANMIVDVGKIIEDRNILYNDIAICIFSVLSVIVMFLENVTAWIPRTEMPSAASVVARTVTKTLVVSTFPTTTDLSSSIETFASTPLTHAPTNPQTTVVVVNARTLPLSQQLSSNELLIVEACVWIILVLSLISCFSIIRLYLRYLSVKQREWCKVGSQDVMARSDAYEFWRSKLPIGMFVEIGIHLVFPYPWWNILDNADAKYLELFMLLRLYTVLRCLHHASPLFRSRREILQTNAELRVSNFTVRLSDTFKLYFFNYTLVSGLVMYLLVACIGGFVTHVAERDSNNGYDPAPNPPFTPNRGFNTLLDGIYFMVMSIRTVGYGDLRPITFVGRCSAVFFQFLGMAAESVIGSVVINKIAKTTEEKMVAEYMGAFTAWYELRVASAMLIQAAWKTSIGYQCRHGKVSIEKQMMARRRFQRIEILRQAVHLQNTQLEVSFQTVNSKLGNTTTANNSAFRDAVKAIREPDDTATSNLGVQNYINLLTRTNQDNIRNMRLAEQMRARTKSSKGVSGYRDEETDLSPYLASREGEKFKELYRRMPYTQKARDKISLPALIARLRSVFSQEANISRWGKNTLEENPRGFKALRTFTVSKPTIDRNGLIRRVPVGEGHKADIRLHALIQFRAARQAFNQTAGTSSDHIVDRNLTIIFKMLVSASKKLKRNSILLQGLKTALQTETEYTDRMLDISLGGGYKIAPISSML